MILDKFDTVVVFDLAVFIDEAHALSNAAQDQLLQVLELPDTAAFVLATNQPERLTPALRSRCIVVKLDVLSDATLIALGRAVCGWESIAFEPDALAMVAAAAQGQARDFLTKLAAVAAQGPVTAAGVGGVLNLAWADVVLTALTLLLRSGYPEADAALRAWSTLPGLKARALRDALAFVAQQRFALTAGASAGAVHAAFLGASASAVDELAAAVAQRATVLGVAPALCVVEWGVFWSACAAGVHDEGDLALRLMEFALRVCPPEVALTPLPPPVVPVAVRPVRRRAIVCAAAWPDAGLNARRVRRDLLSGESFLYLGRTYRLKVVTDPEIQVGLRNGRLLISQHLLKRAPSARKALRDFYIRRGEEVLPSRVQQLAKKVGVQPGRVRVKELGYHWASCGARGDLNFHWKTLMAPRTVLDYVIVHELCHLRHRDHSNAFWNEIDKILPNYRERKQWLRANGASLDI